MQIWLRGSSLECTLLWGRVGGGLNYQLPEQEEQVGEEGTRPGGGLRGRLSIGPGSLWPVSQPALQHPLAHCLYSLLSIFAYWAVGQAPSAHSEN